jgi:AcrR family transcriptional regulator
MSTWTAPMKMNRLAKSHNRNDQTRKRILEKADELFHRFGFYKTTVADIARELEVSPANVFKFYQSKHALIEAVAQQNITLSKKIITDSVNRGTSAEEKLEAFALSIYRFHKNKFRKEKEIYKLIVAAHDGRWPCVVEFKLFLGRILGEIIEEGIRTQEFSPRDIVRTVDILSNSLAWITSPLLMFDLEDVGVIKKVEAQIRFMHFAMIQSCSA